MIPKDLFKKVRQIEITTSRLVTDVFAGEYHSVFKGRGIEFDEVREYQIGDDVRSIDWNVTARTGRPHIKKFVEERELTVMIMVDVSQSCRYGTVNELKSKLAAELAAVLALSAIRNKDKVGLILFTNKIEKFIPPRKGKQHVLRVIREVLYFDPEEHSTDMIEALQYFHRVQQKRSICFLISDFLSDDWRTVEKLSELQKKLSIANKRHDLIAVTLNDPSEQTLSDCGLMTLEDAETGEMVTVDSSDHHFREAYQKRNQERVQQRESLFRSIGMDQIDVSTDEPYAEAIVKFFHKRRHRK